MIGHPAVRSKARVGHWRAVIASEAAAVVLWLLVTRAAGISVSTPALTTTGSPKPLSLGGVMVATSLAVCAAWALLLLIERTTKMSRRTWTAVVSIALLLSLAPLTGHGITAASRMTLAGLHMIVWAVVIVVLGLTARPNAVER